MDPRATFHIADIPVRITPMFFVISIVMSGADSIFVAFAWTAIVFVSILIHELGHALAMRRFGGMPSIELHGMGGTTFWRSRDTLTNGRSILVSIAGPGAGFIFGLFALAVGIFIPPTNFEMEFVLRNLMWVNLAWGLFQLLPIVPLDGGHVLRSLVAMRWPKQADDVADVVTVIVGSAVIGLALYFEAPWPAILIALISYRSFKNMRPFVDRLRDGATFSRVSAFFASATSADEPADIVRAEAILREAKTASGRRAASEALIWACLDAGALHRVDEIIAEHLKGAALSAFIESRIDTAEGRTAAAITRLERHAFYRTGPRELFAYVEACIESDEPERCVESLRAPGGKLDVSAWLARFTARAFFEGKAEKALALSELRHLAFDDARGSFDAARALARLSRFDEAFAAIETCAEHTGAGALDIRGHADLARLRDDPRWVTLLAHLPRG